MRRFIWEWRCHGNVWEVIPSRRYPERDDFQPVCPTCEKPVLKRKWVMVDKD